MFLFLLILIYKEIQNNRIKAKVVPKSGLIKTKCIGLNLKAIFGWLENDSWYEIKQLDANGLERGAGTQSSFSPTNKLLVELRPACITTGDNISLCKGLTPCQVNVYGDGLQFMEKTFRELTDRYQFELRVRDEVISNIAFEYLQRPGGFLKLNIELLGATKALQFHDFKFRLVGDVTTQSVFTCRRPSAAGVDSVLLLEPNDQLNCRIYCRGYFPGSGRRKLGDVECLPSQFAVPELRYASGTRKGELLRLGNEETGHFQEFYSDTVEGAKNNYLISTYTLGTFEEGGRFCLSIHLARRDINGANIRITNDSGTCFEVRSQKKSAAAYVLVFLVVVVAIIFLLISK